MRRPPSVQIDSRLVTNGDVFVAIACPDIARHIAEAIDNGASVVVVPKGYSETKDSRFLYADDERLIASKLSAAFYCESPSNCAAVTGTSGKSSVVHFFSQLFYLNGIDCASIGTNGLFVNGVSEKGFHTSGLTTPSCLDLHKMLAFLKREKGIDYLAFEASSHAIHQKRLHSVKLKVAALTNLASDHIDYHLTRGEYFRVKQKLFSEIGAEVSVFSKDDGDVYNSLMSLPHKKIITFGFDKSNDIVASNIRELPDKVCFDLSINEATFKDICMHLFGKFQVANVLCSIAMAIAAGSSVESMIVKVLPRIRQLDGRMEHICKHRGGDVYVDYAHTAEAFRSCLASFRNICKGRLISVFGCGGDRDNSKRKIIGEIAGELSDINIVTDDNPRTEDPASIRLEIARNCKNVVDIGPRKDAIEYALDIMQKNDFVIIIGKGHETKQIYQNTTLPHNDKEAVLSILSNLEIPN
ncbi:MAG: UDP-N-acetylmuramoyl-L-alanyl-D-glutamate--2,6-diaminopimelate ligase [Holosporales bacterium]|jgi:UDP-N-acetylmuramoyl-L-alanyl-D-glutamate--2,6-diaminopimelate ligase|nr:UDP-N-acetylmuramoyl-L-alanyl-D-glutamate--2,6-diaminopimelate ligase [Holosporales bacterium]